MSHKFADRVADTTSTTGTGAFALDGSSFNAYRNFGDVCSDGDTIYYSASHRVLDQWEVGKATYGAGTNVLTRTTVLASSNAGSAVNFSSGTKDIVAGIPADVAASIGTIGDGGADGYALIANGVGDVPSYQGFLQSGTGAVTRTWNAKASDFITVLDFIPVTEHAAILAFTSVTNCTTYIASAIAALPATGGVLDFPAGLIVTDTIRTPALGKPVWFRGTGNSVLQALNANSPIFAGVSTLAVSPPYVDAHVHSGFILKAHASGSTGAAVDMRKWSFSDISNFRFSANGSGKWAYGFLLDATDHCYGNRVDKVSIRNTSPISTAFIRGATNANAHWFSRVEIVGSTMAAVVSLANSADAFEWQYRDWHVEGISGVSTVAFDLQNGNFRHDFMGCWFEDVGDAFSNTSTSLGSVVNCTFSGSNVQGIDMPVGFSRLHCVCPSDIADVSDYLTGSLELGADLNIPSTHAIIMGNASRFGSGFSAGNAYKASAWDVDGGAWVDFITLTANNTPTCDLADSVTKASNYIYRAGGTVVAVADGGTGNSGTAWSTWSPTVASSGTLPTTATTTAVFKQLGKTIWLTIVYDVTSLGPGSGNITFTIPTGTLAHDFALAGINNSSGGAVAAAAQTATGKIILVPGTLAANKYFVSGTIDLT